jgi:metal transporter CNNM
VQSIIKLPLVSGRCVLPTFNPSPDDPFLQRVNASGKKWVIVGDLSGEPAFVLDAHHFLRDALFNQPDKNKGACWHRPGHRTGYADAARRRHWAPEGYAGTA